MSHAARRLHAWLIFDVGQKMKALVLMFILFVARCATKYIDSGASQPRLNPTAPSVRVFVKIRTMPLGMLKSTLVDGGYCLEAIYLAQHSKTRIRADAPGPFGRGYLMEVVQNDAVVDRFEFWPEEIVVRGQRWLIEDKKFAAHERMVWFGEMPRSDPK